MLETLKQSRGENAQRIIVQVKLLQIFCLAEKVWRKSNQFVSGEVESDQSCEVSQSSVFNHVDGVGCQDEVFQLSKLAERLGRQL
jgi:hypothetical protein